jgi:hypothetical protein
VGEQRKRRGFVGGGWELAVASLGRCEYANDDVGAVLLPTVTCRYHEPRKRGKYEKKNEWLVVSRKL